MQQVLIACTTASFETTEHRLDVEQQSHGKAWYTSTNGAKSLTNIQATLRILQVSENFTRLALREGDLPYRPLVDTDQFPAALCVYDGQ